MKTGKIISDVFNLACRFKVASDDSMKITGRVKNKIIGRESIKKIWVMRRYLRNEK